VKITVLSDASAQSLVLALLPAFAAAVGIPREDERRLGAVVEQLLSFTLDNAYPDDDLGEIEVTLEAGGGSVEVVVHDWGLPLAGVPSAETGAAGVHSAYRGLGVFGRLFEHTLDAATERGLASVFGDAVTIHPFSQRAELSHGYRETALQLGMVPAQTTMRG